MKNRVINTKAAPNNTRVVNNLIRLSYQMYHSKDQLIFSDCMYCVLYTFLKTLNKNFPFS